jgi:flagellar assembly factor FliW
MIVTSRHYGPLHYSEESLIRFANGIPGFEALREFVCFERPEHRPLVYLQSVERSDLCFLALPVRTIFPEYQLCVPPEDLSLLGLPDDYVIDIHNSICLVILAGAPGESPTANLLAPVVINPETRAALQVIQFNSGYSPLLVGEDVEIEILEVGGRVKLGVNAPQHIRIVRKGVEITRRQNLAAAQIEAPDMLRIISYYMESRSRQAGSNGSDLESSKMSAERTGELTQPAEE